MRKAIAGAITLTTLTVAVNRADATAAPIMPLALCFDNDGDYARINLDEMLVVEGIVSRIFDPKGVSVTLKASGRQIRVRHLMSARQIEIFRAGGLVARLQSSRSYLDGRSSRGFTDRRPCRPGGEIRSKRTPISQGPGCRGCQLCKRVALPACARAVMRRSLLSATAQTQARRCQDRVLDEITKSTPPLLGDGQCPGA
jgi:hypothetical protein